ncbi:MAG: recombinase family protein [Firmicutes bacterium HGW-Firmicutes-21]|nr:MAG: recombinase family protein [Firmicutes bacterium HGW-Firmicutes-21]
MINEQKRLQKQQDIEKTRKRMQATIDPDNYEYVPEKKQTDYYDNDINQNVAIYVRVSTDDVKQTTSYELQKKYYEDFVLNHPNWTLVKIYADEGISGTSLKYRDEFIRMVADCKAGKIDIIICKNVSRFARNVTDCIGIVRDLASLKPPVGVFFESESIFSLKEDSQMALTFLATMAEEESHTRSRSMETSLRMRLDNGIPLTPKLLGYTHDANGELEINPDEAPTVKLAFYMYLYGYSTEQIANTFIALGRRSYLGNIKWTAGSIVQILRNERHCGDVYTRKTFTPNYRNHLAKKNRGERPQSRYFNHHRAIVTRDDFIAVQRMLDNAKFGNKSILPELRVIDSGILKGFVTINPRWSGFKETEYFGAAKSVYLITETEQECIPIEVKEEYQLEVGAGDFDLRGFEITRSEFFDSVRRPTVTFGDKKMKFSMECVRKFGEKNYIELLVNPFERKFAIRPTDKNNRNAVMISKVSNATYYPRDISSSAFSNTLFSLFGWNIDCKYRIIGSLYEQDNELAYIFDVINSEALFKPYVLTTQELSKEGQVSIQPLTPYGKRIRAIPEEWASSFGKQFYLHELSLAALESQSEDDWKLRLEGQLFKTGKKIAITEFDELKQYIKQEHKGVTPQEAHHE